MIAIELTDITKVFSAGDFTALDKVSLQILAGECVIIAGSNGSGKSVLMSIIAGLTQATSGTVTTMGRVGLVFQDADTQILGETPEEDVLFSLKNLKIAKAERNDIVHSALKKTGLLKRKGFPSRFLSGGEKRRLATASILAMNCPIVIFDEPFANLDYKGVCQVNELITMLKRENHTIVLLTHELEKCFSLADKFIVLHEGKKVFDGSADSGLQENLEQWSIKNPICAYSEREDLLWI
ncbi:MAG: ABC transporter ATP-binding protein [Spirochaetales bacterium]